MYTFTFVAKANGIRDYDDMLERCFWVTVLDEMSVMENACVHFTLMN